MKRNFKWRLLSVDCVFFYCNTYYMNADTVKPVEKKFSWLLYGFSIFLGSLFVIVFINTFFLHTPGSQNQQGIQCPQGFMAYENTTYSICYPKGWIAHNEADITYADGSISRDIVSFTNAKNENQRIQVIPNRGILAGQSDCLQQQETTINGYSVLRLIYKDSSQNGVCGAIVSYTTVFETQQTTGPYKKGIIIMYVTENGVSLSSDEYATIEN